MKNKLFPVIAIALFGIMLIACSSSNSNQIDKALDNIEKAIKANDMDKASKLAIDFDLNYDYVEDLNKSQQKRYDIIMEDVVDNILDAFDDDFE